MYVTHVCEPGKERLVEFLGYQQSRVAEHNFRISIPRQNKILGASKSSTLELLQQNGFDRDCLPTELGGNIDRSAFEGWIRKRLIIEGAAGAAFTTTLAPRPKQTRQREPFTLGRRPEETHEAFAKRRNAAYVRRVRTYVKF